MARRIHRVTSGTLAGALLAFGAGHARADLVADRYPERLASLAVGIFCRDGVKVSPSEAPGTIKGTVDRMDRSPTLVTETQTIPAFDGLMFGVLVREAIENGDVTITVTHPPLGPTGETTEGWDTTMEHDVKTVHAYFLGLSDGNPVGRWTINGAVNGDLLFYVEFDVIPVTDGMTDPCIFKPAS